MSAPLVVPFNFQPVSVSVKTSAYTIPAGSYALVKTNSAFFSIDAVNVYPSFTIATSAATASTGTKFALVDGLVYVHTASLTVASANANGNSGSYGFGTDATGATAIASVSRTSNGTSAISAGSVPASYLYISCTSGAAGPTTSATASFYASSASSQTEFWVPSGTDLDGNNYVVMLYNEIT